MAAEGCLVSLGDFVKLQRGHDLTAAERKPGRVPVMGSAGRSGFHDVAKTPGPGVVIGRSGVGSMGAVHYCRESFWPHNTTLYVTDFCGNDPLFAYFALRNINFRRFDSGSVQAQLNRNNLKSIQVWCPPLPHQRAIAHILGTLGDKIELNRRTNETLEAMARALFQSWFVDFDPVRAKAAGKRPAGMDPATAALFPSEFVDSEIGEMPKGWNATRLGETYSWSRAGVDPEDSPAASFEHFSLPAFDSGRSPTIDLGATIKSLKFFVPSNSVLVSKLNPAICRVWLPFPSGLGTAVSSTEFLVAVPNADVPRAWLYGAFLSEPVRGAMIGQASGTSNSHQRVRPGDIDSITVAFGAPKLLALYDSIAGSLHEKANGLRIESARLAELRDTLLPRLLSGELRIPDAERFVEDNS